MRPRDSEFHWTHLAHVLFRELRLAPSGNVIVAYSGGLDSSVLLHALTQIPSLDKVIITAAHVNHGLHPDADQWQVMCEQRCHELDVRFMSGQVQVAENTGHGTEAAARTARYTWFENNLPPNSFLLTAHHRDDQAETVMGNLLRGAGIRGLSGIPKRRKLGFGTVLRPLLSYSRDALHQYALAQGLEWIEDPSNTDTGYTRNYLRQSVLPKIEERWPRARHSLARVAHNLSNTVELLQEIAQIDLRGVERRIQGPFFVINSEQLSELGHNRCVNAIRFWFQECGFHGPDSYHIEELVARLLKGSMNPTAVYSWRGVELRFHKRWLYLSRPWTPPTSPPVEWDTSEPLVLPEHQIRLIARPIRGEGLRLASLTDTVTVGWRRGGERCRLPGRQCRHQLKKLFQEVGVPPWLRPQIPLIYINQELAAVVGYWLCEPFVARADEPGIMIHMESWEPNT